MLPLPVAGLEVLYPKENPALGAVLVKAGVRPETGWEYRALLADRVAWMIDHADSLEPLVEAFDALGLEPTRDLDEIRSVISSPEFGQILSALGVVLPLHRPPAQVAALNRLQETPLEEWAAMSRAAT